MLILTFLYNNIRSDRKLCEEIGYNLSYRWFCRLNLNDKVPDHSSMTRIRDRLGEKVFKDIFERVLELCVQNGLIEAKLEGNTCFDRLDYIEQELGYEVDSLTADRGYGYGENLHELKERGKESFVPNFHSDVGGKVDRFKYNKKKNHFICPAGKVLEEKPPPSLKARYVLYTAKQGTCFDCPHLNQCFPKGTKHYRKRLVLSVHRALQEETKAREKTPEFRAKMAERMWKMEGLFGEAKNFMGLSRARYRGRSKMQIQAYMVATTQNLKRLVQVAISWLSSYWLRLKKLWNEWKFSSKVKNFHYKPA